MSAKKIIEIENINYSSHNDGSQQWIEWKGMNEVIDHKNYMYNNRILS